MSTDRLFDMIGIGVVFTSVVVASFFLTGKAIQEHKISNILSEKKIDSVVTSYVLENPEKFRDLEKMSMIDINSTFENYVSKNKNPSVLESSEQKYITHYHQDSGDEFILFLNSETKLWEKRKDIIAIKEMDDSNAN